MCIFTKAMVLLRITKRNYSNSIGPYLLGFNLSICLEDRNVFARFDEIASLTFYNIKETVHTKAIKNYKGK